MKAQSVFLKHFVDEGVPKHEDFEIVETEVEQGSMKDGDVLVQILCFSVDPYLRGMIKSSRGGESRRVMQGFVSGKVLKSNNKVWEEGDLFGANLPFTTIQIVDQVGAGKFWKLTGIITEDQISLGIGILGMPGSTAYAGISLLDPQPGHVVFISAASGAVGSLAGQIAKNVFQARTIGSVGGPEKAKILKDQFDYDEAIDYRQISTKEEFVQALKRSAGPQGTINGYFENVGGITFDAAFECLANKGRIAVCGQISNYNEKVAPGNNVNLMNMIYTQQQIIGFVCHEWLYGMKGNFLEDMSKWWKEGKLNAKETIYQGIENWPTAFISLFEKNDNIGKVVVKL